MSLVKDVLMFAGGIILPNAVGFLGARSTRHVVQGDWYKTLKKAPFNPPSWVFPIAWTSLYASMGTASVLVYRSAGGSLTPDVTSALLWYGGQLAINGAWSPIFFNYRKLGLAFLWILVLDAAVAVTTYKFSIVSPAAGYLFYPYMGWCMFATILSYSIWLLNYDSEAVEK